MATMSLARAQAIKGHHSRRLMEVPGVWGVGVEKGETGHPVLVVHTDGQHPVGEERIPPVLDGLPVRIVRDAPFRKQS